MGLKEELTTGCLLCAFAIHTATTGVINYSPLKCPQHKEDTCEETRMTSPLPKNAWCDLGSLPSQGMEDLRHPAQQYGGLIIDSLDYSVGTANASASYYSPSPEPTEYDI